jgi:hypothetical protein
MKCDKCGKEMKGASIMVDFGLYHLTCTDRRPLRGRIADAMEKDISIFLDFIRHLFQKIKSLFDNEKSIIRLHWERSKKHYG